jgi:hypothetical protein
MAMYSHRHQKLFYIELIDEDGDRWVEWEWANNEQEVLSTDRFGTLLSEVRQATEDETNAWNDGYNESIGIGLAEERIDNWNGVAYKVTSLSPLTSTKIFTCGVCLDEYEFSKASKLGNFHLAVTTPKEEQTNKTVLWHVCVECSIN